MPQYDLNDFITACLRGLESVDMISPAPSTARNDFGLHPKSEVIKNIANGEICGFVFDKKRPWKNNPDPKNNPIEVDSYDFFFGEVFGYMAFFFQPRSSKWIIKSFKKNDKPNPRLNIFQNALQKALKEKDTK